MAQPLEQNGISRRQLLKLGIGTIGKGAITCLGAGVLASQLGRSTLAAELSTSILEPQISETSLTPDRSLERLLEGNRRFVARQRITPHQDRGRLGEVANGQVPFAAILSCADSRVVPEIVFDQGIGDLFVVRVAGNLANQEDTASEEYATEVLGASLLMVLGHERCGAVQAALKGTVLPGAMGSLVAAIRPAIVASEGKPGDRLENAVKANVLLQMRQLQASPILSQRIQQGKLQIVGAYYDLDSGVVSLVS